MNQVHSLGAAVVLGFVAVACGSADKATFSDTDGQNGKGGSSDGNFDATAEIGPSGTASACVTDIARTGLTPTNLVIVYDKSGSMGDTATGFDPAARWMPVNAGMKEFFADPYSATLRASLQFFPLDDDTIETTCAYPYASPAVPLRTAADPAFAQALDTAAPSGGTPTLPALEGGIQYATQIAATDPEAKTVVVLVTDGEPGFWDAGKNAFVPGCANNDVGHVAAAAKTAHDGAPSIATYVVGVGPKLESLNSIAAAGGTNAALMVDVADPGATTKAIVQALDGIRRKEVTCDFALPPAPAGEELDPYAVNVALANADGSETLLSYSKECASADGWRYDDARAPKRILLCNASCDAAKTGRDGQVTIAFGCKTKMDLR